MDSTENPLEQNNKRPCPSPLADPIFAEIFRDANSSFRAMESLINSVFNNQGRAPISKILSITPQRVHLNIDPKGRSYRLDVEVLTLNNERVDIEVQLSSFDGMTERNLLNALDSLSTGAKKGQKFPEIIDNIPRLL